MLRIIENGPDYFGEEEDSKLHIECVDDEEFMLEAISLLQSFYELHSAYGDPVEDLVKLMTPEQITKALERVNYIVKEKEGE